MRGSYVVLLVAVLAPVSARAGNDDEVFLGNQAAMSGGAVTATVNDGASLLYEPSGLVEGDDDTVDVSVTALGLRAHRAEAPLALPMSGAGDAHFLELISIPTTLAYTRTLSPRVRMGIGVFATRGSTIRVRESLDVDTGAEHSHYQLTIAQRGSTLVAAAGIGYRATDSLRLGMSLSIVNDSDDNTLLVSASRMDTSGPAEITTDSVTSQRMSSYSRFGLRATFGIRYVPNDRFRLAASLVTPGLAVAGILSESSNSTLFSSRPAIPISGATSAETEEFSFQAGLFSSFRVRLGVAVRVRATTLSVDADFQARVRDATYGVLREGVINGRVGVRVVLSDKLTMGAGLFTDRTGVDANASVRGSSEDRNFYGTTLGIERVRVRRLADGEDARALRFVSTYALRYSFGFGKGSGLVTSASFDASSPDALRTRLVRIVHARARTLHRLLASLLKRAHASLVRSNAGWSNVASPLR